MIGAVNHVAIAVPNLKDAVRDYRERLGAKVSEAQHLPEHGVRLVFVDTGNTKVELLEPSGEGSPIAAFLERNPRGGMHHICYEVSDVTLAAEQLVAGGARVLGEPRIGAHGNPVVFLHPNDFGGVLIELEEVRQPAA